MAPVLEQLSALRVESLGIERRHIVRAEAGKHGQVMRTHEHGDGVDLQQSHPFNCLANPSPTSPAPRLPPREPLSGKGDPARYSQAEGLCRHVVFIPTYDWGAAPSMGLDSIVISQPGLIIGVVQ